MKNDISEKKASSEFQSRLIELIEENDFTRTEFAGAIGISRGTISRATTYGIVPNLSSLTRIADYFNVSLEYLLGKNNENDFYKSASSKSFHERLLELTKENETKFSVIAHKMPFSRNLFHDWLRRGILPNLDNLYALAKYFKVSPDYLLGRTDDRNY